MSAEWVMVTGAAGLIGRAVRRKLAGRFRVVCVDLRRTEPLSLPAADEEIHLCDVGDVDAFGALWRSLGARYPSCAGIIHLAWYYDFKNQMDPRYQMLLRGLEHWLPWIARDLPAHVPFLYASSMASLAPSEPGQKLTEQSPRMGGWAYPASKIAAEQILERAQNPQPRGELVLAGVYSDHCELVPLFQLIERVRSRSPEKFLLPASPDRGLTYVHLDEVADAFVRALAVLRGWTGVHRFLIGQQAPVTYREIHRKAALALTGRRLPILRVPKTVARFGAGTLAWYAQWRDQRRFIQPWMIAYAGEHFEFDLTHTKSVLGWQPERFLGTDLDAIVAFARDHQGEWLALNHERPW